MKMRNKGKVHPFSPTNTNTQSLSVLNLLPSTILTLISILSLQDKEVLAYMLTRSIQDEKKKPPHHNKAPNFIHKTPFFDCGCFYCYTSYWYKWDSSPNRELIHQAIEAFEDHFNNGGVITKKTRRKEKVVVDKIADESLESVEIAVEDLGENEAEVKEEEEEVVVAPVVGNEKGLVRKVLPDVMGLLSSRLWSLWSPNV